MEVSMLQLSLAILALSVSAACTCELTLGPGAGEQTSPPVLDQRPAPAVTQQAAAIDPAQKPLAAAAVTPPPASEPTGVLTEASVRRTEARHHSELRFCMEQDPSSSKSSKMRVQFVVKPDGSVDNNIEVLERTDASDRLAACLVHALKRWKFETPKGGPARATLLLKR